MNGTTPNLASIKPEVIWIPYSIFLVLTIAVLALSFVRYHRRKTAKRKYIKEYADENLKVKRARISGITCNSNDMRLVDLASSVMHPEIFRLYSDLSIQALPNFARHNLELKSNKGTDDEFAIDVNKVVMEDWMEQEELQELRIPKMSASFQKGSSEGLNRGYSEGFHKESSATFKNASAIIHKSYSEGVHKDSSARDFYKESSATFNKGSSESHCVKSSAGLYKDSDDFDNGLVEIELDDVCETCRKTVLLYHERKRPHRLNTFPESQDFKHMMQGSSFVPIVDSDIRTSEHFRLCTSQCCESDDTMGQPKSIMELDSECVTIVGKERFEEYQHSLMRPKGWRRGYDNVAFTSSDIYAIPDKKRWTHKSNNRCAKPTGDKDVSENSCNTAVDSDRRKRYENIKIGINPRKTLSRRKRSAHLKPNKRVPSVSQTKHRSHHYVNTFHKRHWSRTRVATDYSSTSSSERQSDDDFHPYEKIWFGRNELEQTSAQHLRGSQSTHNDTYQNRPASMTEKRNTNPVQNCLKGHKILSLPWTNFQICQTAKIDLKNNFDTNVKTQLLKRNSSSENYVTYEKRLLAGNSQINSNSIETLELSGIMDMEPYSGLDISKKMKVPKVEKLEISENLKNLEFHSDHDIPKNTNNLKIETMKFSGIAKNMKPFIGHDIQKKTKVPDKRNRSERSITSHQQLIRCPLIEQPCDLYLNYTDAEKMKQVAPIKSENPSGDIYWLDIHNEDTMV